MGLSDCVKCWNTPCNCGYEYRNMSRRSRIELASAILGVSEELLSDKVKNFTPKHHPMQKDK